MKQIPQSFRSLLQSGNAVEPFVLAAVYHDPDAIADSLFSTARLRGDDDVASANDTNIRLLNNKIALSKGANVPMASASISNTTTISADWSLVVKENGAWEWK